MEKFLEIAGVFFLSGIKFILAPAAAVALGYGFIKTVLITFSGGSSGVLFFYYLGRAINRKWKGLLKGRTDNKKLKKTNKFNVRNKMIVSFKIKYGLFGLAIVTPVFFSIPFGVIIASKYFKSRITPLYFIVCIFLWTLLLTTICFYLQEYFYF